MPFQAKAPQRWFLVAVFLAIGIAISTSFVFYSLQPSRPPPTDNLIFTSASLVDGNASFEVQNVSHGPYSFSGFGFRLVVNNFAVGPVALGPNHSATRIAIGPTFYRVSWTDADGDGAVSVGDSFLVTGDNAPLPSLSAFEFALNWMASWVATATWYTE